jgi:hypothetical protein
MRISLSVSPGFFGDEPEQQLFETQESLPASVGMLKGRGMELVRRTDQPTDFKGMGPLSRSIMVAQYQSSN